MLHVLTLLLLLLLLLLLSCHLLVHVLLVLLVLCTRVTLCHPCMMCMHKIRGRTRVVFKVPGEEAEQRRGFRSGRRFASCLRGGGRGKFSAGRRCTGAGCRFTSQEATRHRNQAGQGEVWTHLPSTRRFLVSNSCHLDADWTSDNQWAGRRCVVPHDRGFGC